MGLPANVEGPEHPWIVCNKPLVMHLHILLSLRQDTPALCAPLRSNLELITLSKASAHISSGNPARALEVTVLSSPILGPATKELIQSGLGSPQGR